jgi:hypothetical protein
MRRCAAVEKLAETGAVLKRRSKVCKKKSGKLVGLP